LQKTVTISKDHRNTLISHAKKQFPNESCALLFGTEENGSFQISDVFLTQSSGPSPREFTIANEDLIRGYNEAERLDLDVIGIFHSHPHSEAAPSQTDRKYMEVNPVVWVIFSNKYEDLKAYVLESDIVAVPVKIE